MKRLISNISHRHSPTPSLKAVAFAGVGGALAIALLGWLSSITVLKLLLAPMGASCVLLFSGPVSPFSQPVNVIVGHFLAAIVGLLVAAVFPGSFYGAGLAAGLAIAVMLFARVTHPPAGAMALVAYTLNGDWKLFLISVFVAATILVVVAGLWHRATGVAYPLAKPHLQK